MEAVQTDLKRKKEKKQRKRGLEGKSACQKGFLFWLLLLLLLEWGRSDQLDILWEGACDEKEQFARQRRNKRKS